jgi:predicted amidophosphoribosyltransferase
MTDYSSKLASSAISTIIGLLIFGLIAEFLVGWQWWIYMIMGFIMIGFLGSLLRFFFIAGKKCPQCGDNISVDAKFCKNCGFQFYKKCPKCGILLRSGAKFCDKCGSPLGELT